MNKLIFAILIFTLISCQEDEKKFDPNEIESISLKYGHTMSDESLIVNIYNYQADNIDLNYKYSPHRIKNQKTPQFKSRRLSKSKFDSLVKLIDGIDRKNMEMQAEYEGLEGYNTSIAFININQKTIINNYSIWTPSSNTKKRKLSKYLNVCYELAKLAEIDPNSIFLN